MDVIPQEIMDSIVERIARSKARKLSPYASISKKWQKSVERITFRSLKISTYDMENFKVYFRGDKVLRRGHLRSIEIQYYLPPCGKQGCCLITRRLDLEGDSRFWSAFVKDLFFMLDDLVRRYKVLATEPPPISLTMLNAKGADTAPQLTNEKLRCFYREDGECKKHEEHTESLNEACQRQPGAIRLYETNHIPSLCHISAFKGHGWGVSRFLHPEWMRAFFVSCHLLENIELHVVDAYSWGRIWRSRFQKALANSLDKLPATQLKIFHLHVYSRELLNEDVEVHQLAPTDEHVYNRLLQNLSTFPKLVALYLKGPLTVSPTLFQCCLVDTPIFPQLERFTLEFTPQTSDGRWFYLLDDPSFLDRSGSDIEDEGWPQDHYPSCFGVYGDSPVKVGEVSDFNKYRSLPNIETLVPFLSSAATVCSNMPKIRAFSLKLNNIGMSKKRLDYACVNRVFELWYFSSGTSAKRWNRIMETPSILVDATISHYNRVYFRVDKYLPAEGVVSNWREAVGPNGKINFLDEASCCIGRYRETLRFHYKGMILQET